MSYSSENDENLSDNSENSDDKEQVSKKRKGEQNGTCKKIKYENINDEGKSKKRKNELYKAPTVEELNQLKETENLYNNNLFRLQITELVSEIQIKNKRKKFVTTWLDSFKVLLENATEYESVQLSDVKPVPRKRRSLTKQDKFIHKIASNYKCEIKTDQDVTLNFLKPESFETFGMYETNSLPGPKLLCNVNVKIPKACFHVKDYSNNRYLVKRYYYLLYIAECLKAGSINGDLSIAFHEDNALLPILQIIPQDCDKILISIYATPSEDYFKPNRFLPEHNNIKASLFEAFSFNNLEILKNTPTLLYNCTLLHDVTLTQNNLFIRNVLKDRANVLEGIKLLCVWARQRELNIGLGGFTDDLITYLIVFLLTKKRINQHMSSYQIIRNFWNFITANDLEESPISIRDNVAEDVMNCFKGAFQVVLLDITGCYNVAGFLNLEVYRKFKGECELALKHLDDNRINSFQSLFITRQPFHLQYDLILDLTDCLSLSLNNIPEIDDKEKSAYVGFEKLLITNYIIKLLHKGLNKRVLNIVPRYEKNDPKLLFGVNLNPEEAFNFIELGPALNDYVEASKFRKFWGKLSSDRRFRDGTTKVAVYYKTNTIKDKRGIIKNILDFLLHEKLKVKYKLHYDEFEDVLVNYRVKASYPIGTNEESSLRVVTTSDELGKKIRSLQMSLSITGLQGISDVYSYTEVFPPISTNPKLGQTPTTVKGENIIFKDEQIEIVPRYVQPVECVLQLEHSSKWPNNLEGVKLLKTSFYLEISKLLSTKFNILSHVSREYFDVFYEGLVFRYKLYLPKEIALLKKNLNETGVTFYKDSLEATELEKNLNILPRVNGALKGLQSQNPSYGPGTALIKRWLRSQLIDDFHFPDVVINLLNASLYLNGTTFAASNTPQISFLRFLKFFSELQWNLQPVVVNFNDELSNDEIAEIDSNLQQNRDAHPALFIITPFDKCQSVFTKNAPSKHVLQRVRELAGGMLNFVTGIIQERNFVGIKEAFIPNWDGYNILIHLHPFYNSRRYEQVKTFENEPKIELEAFNATESKKIPIIGFNPVQIYLNQLRENYGEYATFFHDTYGGSTIGVLWAPKVDEIKDFKVSHVNGRKLVDETLVFNTEAIIEDFYILGKDLVKLIEKK